MDTICVRIGSRPPGRKAGRRGSAATIGANGRSVERVTGKASVARSVKGVWPRRFGEVRASGDRARASREARRGPLHPGEHLPPAVESRWAGSPSEPEALPRLEVSEARRLSTGSPRRPQANPPPETRTASPASASLARLLGLGVVACARAAFIRHGAGVGAGSPIGPAFPGRPRLCDSRIREEPGPLATARPPWPLHQGAVEHATAAAGGRRPLSVSPSIARFLPYPGPSPPAGAEGGSRGSEIRDADPVGTDPGSPRRPDPRGPSSGTVLRPSGGGSSPQRSSCGYSWAWGSCMARACARCCGTWPIAWERR